MPDRLGAERELGTLIKVAAFPTWLPRGLTASQRDEGTVPMNRNRLVCCLAAIGASAVLFAAPAPSFANDNCQRLETLSQQYAGVELTSDQEKLKRRLVVWYHRNCGDRQSAEAN